MGSVVIEATTTVGPEAAVGAAVSVAKSPFLELAQQLVVLDTASLAFMAAYYVFVSADPKMRESAYTLVGATALLTSSIILGTVAVGLNLLELRLLVAWPAIASGLTFAGSWCLFFFALIHSFARAFYLRDRRYIKYIGPLRWWSQRKISAYVNSPVQRRGVDNRIVPIPQDDSDAIRYGFSLLVIADCPMDVARNYAASILTDGLLNEETANYVCSEISPVRALGHFDRIKEIDYRSLVFIDAFTTHYGYYDEIAVASQRFVREQGIGVIPAFTIAGVHSAGNSAWHLARRHQAKSGKADRRPNRIVYDCISALAPFSSEMLVKAFVTHSINSEKLYGMISVYLERPDSVVSLHAESLVDGVIIISQEGKSFVARTRKWKNRSNVELSACYTNVI